nr:ribonuclease H-like domain-containing protein [Tanacetum cinerariifolium]
AVLTKSGQVPVNAAKQCSHRAATSVSAARHVNTAASRLNVNNALPITYSYFNAHSPVRRHFNQKSAAKTNNFNEKVNTAKDNNVTTAGPKAVTISQISAIDKTGLGYDGQMNESVLNDIHVNKSEVLNNVFDSHESDGDDNQVNDRFKKGEGYHAVPPPYTGNYMPPRADLSFAGLDNSVFKSKEWESNSKDENVFKPKEVKKIIKPSLEKIEFVNARYTIVENENKAEKPRKFSQSPRDYQEINGGFVAFGGNAKGGIENQTHKVKTIRCDNGTEFKNRIMNEFCETKGTRREFSVARTPQQNDVAERKNNTLVEVARTMLADSKLPTTFWAKAVNTICYVQNRVLVIKPHNKTPYEIFLGRKPFLSFMRPFGCLVTILNTLDYLGKFDGKSDDGFFVGYSINSKAFRVFNTRTRFIEENLHINFLKNKPNVARTGPNWMFEIDTLTMSMNYQPFFTGNQTNGNARTKTNIDAGQAGKKTVHGPQYVLLPLLTSDSQCPKSSKDEVVDDAGKKSTEVPIKENRVQDPSKEDCLVKGRMLTLTSLTDLILFGQDKDANSNKMFIPVSNAGSTYVNLGGSIPINVATLPNADIPNDPLMPDLEDTTDLQDTGIFSGAYDDEVNGAVADFNNLKLTTVVSPIPTTKIHKDHPKEKIIVDPLLALQTRRMTKTSQEHAMVMQRDNGIFISQDKYVADILKKFDFSSVKTASTPIKTNKALLKDEEDEDVDVHLYKSIIGSLMYLTASKPDIMFVV